MFNFWQGKKNDTRVFQFYEEHILYVINNYLIIKENFKFLYKNNNKKLMKKKNFLVEGNF